MELSGTLILAGLVAALLWLFSMKNSRKFCLPPGPPGLPIVRNILQLEKKNSIQNSTDGKSELVYFFSFFTT